MYVRHQPTIITYDKGFTFIEVTLALLIAALVMSVVYGSIKGVTGSLESISIRSELDRINYALLEEMTRELSAAFRSGYETLNINQGRARTYLHIESLEEDKMHQAKLYFTTYGHAFSPEPLGEGDQSEVCYKTHYDRAKDELILLKREDAATNEITCREDESLFDLDHPSGERPYVVARSINTEKGSGYRFIGFEVIPFGADQQAGQQEEESLKTWDTDNEITQRNQLPRQVQITLTYEGPRKDIITYSRPVWLQLSGPSTAPVPSLPVPSGPRSSSSNTSGGPGTD